MREPNETKRTITPVGIQKLYKFDNGYGASVVCNEMSYGGKDGLWELAVLDKDGELTYDTPVANDVTGWLTEDQVDDMLNKIDQLPGPRSYGGEIPDLAELPELAPMPESS